MYAYDTAMHVASKQLNALADPTRLVIFDLVRSGPTSVRGLSDQLPVSQPAVSQHLKVLEGARLVRWRPEGARHIYTVDPVGIQTLRGWIESMWDDVLDAFGAAAAQEHSAEESAQEMSIAREQP